jgi:hypothetical protein
MNTPGNLYGAAGRLSLRHFARNFAGGGGFLARQVLEFEYGRFAAKIYLAAR